MKAKSFGAWIVLAAAIAVVCALPACGLPAASNSARPAATPPPETPTVAPAPIQTLVKPNLSAILSIGLAGPTPAPTPPPLSVGVFAGCCSSAYSVLAGDGSLWTMERLGSPYSVSYVGGKMVTGYYNEWRKVMEGVKAESLGSDIALILKTDSSLWEYKIENGQDGMPWKVLDGVQAAAAGGSHALALKQDGTLWAWGDNSDGQLGDGTNENRAQPEKVMDGVSAVAAGIRHSLAVKQDGSLWAWGDNSCGQLGDGTVESKSTPVKILDGVASVAAGNGCLVKTYQYVSFETQVWTGKKWTTKFIQTPIGPGFYTMEDGSYSAAVLQDGSLWEWGANNCGQLGDGTTKDRLKPIKGGDGYQAVAAGAYRTFGLKQDGSLWQWGLKSLGPDETTKGCTVMAPTWAFQGVAAVAANQSGGYALTTGGSCVKVE